MHKNWEQVAVYFISISHRLMCTVAAPAALYKLMVASIGEQDMQAVQSKCYIACKAALGLARSTPNDVVSAVVSLDWWNRHCTNQMLMVMKMLLSNRDQTKGMLVSSLQMHQLWAGSMELGLGEPESQGRGWDGTMLGRLPLWMGQHGFQLKGGGALPLGREHDQQLTVLARGNAVEDEKELIAAGSIVAYRHVEALRHAAN